jgi:antitoxin CptB
MRRFALPRAIMISDSEYKRVYWASRRGMLELDLILVPFFEQCFRDLSEADQQIFIRLLEEEDTDLFAWFLGRGEPEDPELASIVQRIHAYARQG